MNKQSLYQDAFVVPLVIRELSDDSLQFATLDSKIIERIRVASELHAFGSFSAAPAWGTDVGRIKRAHLYVGWLFDLEEVASYLAGVAQCKYTISFRVGEHKQQYGCASGDSSEGEQNGR